MARRRGAQEIRIVGRIRRSRRDLLLGTAWQAASLLALAVPAAAQPAPGARPTGGTVVAGSAAIAQTPTTTTITQSSQRAAIDWRGFSVGGQQAVTFAQPSSKAVALNRVTGPDPSQIAGRIDANGQIVLVNPAGVTFYKGAQVNAQSLIVTPANISNGNFMAGKMVFDTPAPPDSQVVNQGTITVKQAGLAALVAPRVANSGTIVARMGHVVLAGARSQTMDLYGDGLLALDVTNQLTSIPAGAAGGAGTALVTNTGVIRADGGTVQLTAAAADGVVRRLVDAGGKISADSIGLNTGTVTIDGIGGAVTVTGLVRAAGRGAGTTGGQIEVNSTGNVILAPTARVDASGRAGGGSVAIGTTLARAKGGPGTPSARTAPNVVVAQGATIAANGDLTGNGGRVTVLSRHITAMAGSIQAKGGKQSGDGGFVEVSGDTLLLSGLVDTSAPHGHTGTLLLDPTDLAIVASTSITPSSVDREMSFGTLLEGAADGAPLPSTISTTTIQNQSTSTIIIQASGTIDVQAPLTVFNGLTLQAGGQLTVEAGAPITAGGGVLLQSGPNAGILINDSVTSNARFSTVQLSAGTGGITLNGNIVTSFGVVDLSTTGGGITQAGNVGVTAELLQSTGGAVGNVSLIGANAVSFAGDFRVTPDGAGRADFSLLNGINLTLSGTQTAQNAFYQVAAGRTLFLGNDGVPLILTGGSGGRISLVADQISIQATNTITAPGGTLEIAPVSAINTSLQGAVSTSQLTIDPQLLSSLTPGLATLTVGGFTDAPRGATQPAPSASSVTVDAATTIGALAATLNLMAMGPVTQSAPIQNVSTLIGTTGLTTLTDLANSVSVLGDYAAGNSFTLTDSVNLAIAGQLTTSGTATLTIAGTLTETGAITAAQLTGTAISLASLTGNNSVANLNSFSVSGASGQLIYDDPGPLTVSGTISANRIAISNPGGSITLANGIVIRTGGTTRPQGTTVPNSLLPANGAPGAYFQAASFAQQGQATVVNRANGPSSLQISSAGDIRFDTASGLFASNTWLTLNMTTGNATGNVFVNALDVSYAKPGGANLFGSIGGVATIDAARLGHIRPTINGRYLFNTCVIASPICESITDFFNRGQTNETTVYVPIQALLAQITPALVLDPGQSDDLLEMPVVSREDY